MPIYAYKCESCGHAKDVLQKMSDDLLTTCPSCGAATFVKQLTAAGFQLKGSGWYATDFKGGPASAAAAPASAAVGADGAASATPATNTGGTSSTPSTDSSSGGTSASAATSSSSSAPSCGASCACH